MTARVPGAVFAVTTACVGALGLAACGTAPSSAPSLSSVATGSKRPVMQGVCTAAQLSVEHVRWAANGAEAEAAAVHGSFDVRNKGDRCDLRIPTSLELYGQAGETAAVSVTGAGPRNAMIGSQQAVRIAITGVWPTYPCKVAVANVKRVGLPVGAEQVSVNVVTGDQKTPWVKACTSGPSVSVSFPGGP